VVYTNRVQDQSDRRLHARQLCLIPHYQRQNGKVRRQIKHRQQLPVDTAYETSPFNIIKKESPRYANITWRLAFGVTEYTDFMTGPFLLEKSFFVFGTGERGWPASSKLYAKRDFGSYLFIYLFMHVLKINAS